MKTNIFIWSHMRYIFKGLCFPQSFVPAVVMPQAFFFPEKGRSQMFWTCPDGEISVFISFHELSSILLPVQHAAGAFFSGKKVILDFCALCKHAAGAFFSGKRWSYIFAPSAACRRRLFFWKKSDPRFLRPLQHATGAFFFRKKCNPGIFEHVTSEKVIDLVRDSPL